MPLPEDCTRARKLVSIQLDGELSELGSARLAAHLRRCPDCTVFAQSMTGVVGRLRSAPLEQPSRDVAAVRRRRQLVLSRTIGAAAASAVAVGAASFVAVVGALHTGAPAAPQRSASSASVQDRASEQRLVALLSRLNAAPAPPDRRLTAL